MNLMCMFLNEVLKLGPFQGRDEIVDATAAWILGDRTETMEQFLDGLEHEHSGSPATVKEAIGRTRWIGTVIAKRRKSHETPQGGESSTESRTESAMAPHVVHVAQEDAREPCVIVRVAPDVTDRRAPSIDRSVARRIGAHSDRANSARAQAEDCYRQARDEWGDADRDVQDIRALRDAAEKQWRKADAEYQKELKRPGTGSLEDAELAAAEAVADATKAMARLRAKRRKADQQL